MSILLRVRHRIEAEKRARIQAELQRDTHPEPANSSATPAGDERRLRGIPAIGRGVTGAIPNTIPHRDLPAERHRPSYLWRELTGQAD